MSEILKVDFKPAAGAVDDVGLRVKRREYSGCQHPRVYIDEEHRTVECRECKVKLDSVWVLLAWARHWERYAESVKALRLEQEQRTASLEQLRKHEARVKARIRRAAALAGQAVPKWAMDQAEAEERSIAAAGTGD